MFICTMKRNKRKIVMKNFVFNKINNMGLPFIDKYEVNDGVRVLRFKGSIDAETIPIILKIK